MKLKKLAAGLTAAVMMTSIAGCSNDSSSGGTAKTKDNGPIQLTCYSQLANSAGELTGWFAEVLKREFNVVMTIIPDSDGMFDTRMESGNLGDLVIFGSNGSQYQRAAKEGMLFDWNEDDILTEYGAYIKENMTYALENNRELNKATVDKDTVFGIGHNIAYSPEDHEAFFYTWDIRWDLYKELGYPEIKDLNDLKTVMAQMKEISPKDENGNETYAVSLWPDWDGSMVMYVKAFATAYWGYDELGFGVYDVDNGKFHYALEENGPYLQSLKFFNDLFQAGLVDPNSMTQTYSEMTEKTLAGGTFFSIFNYSGSEVYNTEEHKAANKIMATLTPTDATPLCYGMNVKGGNRIWTIGANSEYPELVMEIINYLATPEGYMTYNYGPKDLCWYYDENMNCCLTELGESAKINRKETMMPEEWGGGSFNDGTFQANNTTWSLDAPNLESNGETFNANNWKSRRTGASCDILQDWMDKFGVYNSEEYLNTKPYKIALATGYAESSRSDELEIIWEQIKKCIVNYSWQAIYAKDEAEFDKIVAEMIQKCSEYDPNGECLAWCESEAAIRCALEDEVR